MKNQLMFVDLFENQMMCETEGAFVCLNDLFDAGNAWRLTNGMKAYQMGTFLRLSLLETYIRAASDVWQLPPDHFIKKARRGGRSCTMVHISVAVLAAEQISPYFHALVHKIFIEERLLQYRDWGGNEFKKLNFYVDHYLPGRQEKDNKGIYIQLAKKMREKILGKGAKTEDWNTANAQQTRQRYEVETKLCELLELDLIRDWDHLKELVGKL